MLATAIQGRRVHAGEAAGSLSSPPTVRETPRTQKLFRQLRVLGRMMDVEDDTQPDDTLEYEEEWYGFSASHSPHTPSVATLAAFATPGPSVTPVTAFDEALRHEKGVSWFA